LETAGFKNIPDASTHVPYHPTLQGIRKPPIYNTPRILIYCTFKHAKVAPVCRSSLSKTAKNIYDYL